jgi:hypothetical protein
MKLRNSMIVAALSLFSLNSLANIELGLTSSPLPLIPAKAVSCYSSRITPPNQTPYADVDDSHFRIPSISFIRKDSSKDLIISTIRVTYAIPRAKGEPADLFKCMIAGDSLRALSGVWWSGGPEAVVHSGVDTFTTDCAAYCGGIKTTADNFTVPGSVEIYGFERDAVTRAETPVKLNGSITIEAF